MSLINFILGDCEWNKWTAWSQCTQTCDGGLKTRTRKRISSGGINGAFCSGSESQSNNCNTKSCSDVTSPPCWPNCPTQCPNWPNCGINVTECWMFFCFVLS